VSTPTCGVQVSPRLFEMFFVLANVAPPSPQCVNKIALLPRRMSHAPACCRSVHRDLRAKLVARVAGTSSSGVEKSRPVRRSAEGKVRFKLKSSPTHADAAVHTNGHRGPNNRSYSVAMLVAVCKGHAVRSNAGTLMPVFNFVRFSHTTLMFAARIPLHLRACGVPRFIRKILRCKKPRAAILRSAEKLLGPGVVSTHTIIDAASAGHRMRGLNDYPVLLGYIPRSRHVRSSIR